MGKRNGVLRFWGALALCLSLCLSLCLCTGALAESLQGYTVAEKLIKQLNAGSGFPGTLEVQTDGADAPLSFQWDYIHTRKNSETVEQQRLESPADGRRDRPQYLPLSMGRPGSAFSDRPLVRPVVRAQRNPYRAK